MKRLIIRCSCYIYLIQDFQKQDYEVRHLHKWGFQKCRAPRRFHGWELLCALSTFEKIRPLILISVPKYGSMSPPVSAQFSESQLNHWSPIWDPTNFRLGGGSEKEMDLNFWYLQWFSIGVGFFPQLHCKLESWEGPLSLSLYLSSPMTS